MGSLHGKKKDFELLQTYNTGFLASQENLTFIYKNWHAFLMREESCSMVVDEKLILFKEMTYLCSVL